MRRRPRLSRPQTHAVRGDTARSLLYAAYLHRYLRDGGIPWPPAVSIAESLSKSSGCAAGARLGRCVPKESADARHLRDARQLLRAVLSRRSAEDSPAARARDGQPKDL